MPSRPTLLALLALLALLPLLGLSACGHRRHLTLQPPLTQAPPVTSKAFAQDLATASGAAWTQNNEITTLENGGLFYPPMLEAIKRAKKSVTFETFAFIRGIPSYYFSLAMAERARAGVPVHVILDASGSRQIGPECKTILRDAGVQLHFYRPINIFRPAWSNNRDHRKILVVDGEVAFTGGAGFATGWMGHAQSPDHWRDTQYEIRGPAVAQLQHIFTNNWHELTGETLAGPAYFPPLSGAGTKTAQLTLGAPMELGPTLGQSYLLAIAAARKSLLIAHSYFTPNPTVRKALTDAAKRGVHIEIIVPGPHIDVPPSRTAARLHFRELLDAGIRLWEYQPTMMHGKLIVVDDHLVIAGSGNLDDRSLFLNDENNLHVLDPAFAAEQTAMFLRDRTRCREITREELRFSLFQAPSRLFARLLAPQL